MRLQSKKEWKSLKRYNSFYKRLESGAFLALEMPFYYIFADHETMYIYIIINTGLLIDSYFERSKQKW